MSTVTARKQVVGTWCDVLTSGQLSQRQSLTFVKKLTALAISNIVYLRAIFPEGAFGDRSYEDMNFKLLKENSKCPSGSTLIKWVRGSFDALDKKYLRQMILGVFKQENNPNMLLESYTFHFAYQGSDTSVCLFRNETEIGRITATKKATTMLLRTLVVVMQNLKPLPDNICMTMKLQYYDEVTPEDYEPPGFKPCETPFDYETDVMTVKIGNVKTPFHDLKLRIKSDKSQFQIKDAGKCAAVRPQGPTIAEKEIERKNDSERDLLVSKLNEIGLNSPPKTAAVNDMVIDKENGPHPNGDVPNPDDCVRCPCGVNEDDGLMILCAICDMWQHAICFKVQSADDAPDRHICELCGQVGKQGREPTDGDLVGLAADAIQKVCLYRRSLQACLDLKSLTPNELAVRLGVKSGIAFEIMDRLQKEKFAKKSRGPQRIINRDRILRVGIPRYCSKNAGNEQQTCPSTMSDVTQRSAKRSNNYNMDMTEFGQEFNFGPSQDTDDFPTDAKRKKMSEVSKLLANL